MYIYLKVMAIFLLLIAGALLHKGITQKIPSDVIYSVLFVVLTYVNPYVWNETGKNKRGN